MTAIPLTACFGLAFLVLPFLLLTLWTFHLSVLHTPFATPIIPFHSFAHTISPDDQRKVLDRILQHLSPGGTFICTLSNPNLRRKAVDGQLRLFRKYPLPDDGMLLLWITEKLNADDRQVVEAMQFYEEHDARGILRSKRLLELHFRLSTRGEFEELVRSAGFKVKAFYGDYEHSEFENDSPFMIWILENAG